MDTGGRVLAVGSSGNAGRLETPGLAGTAELGEWERAPESRENAGRPLVEVIAAGVRRRDDCSWIGREDSRENAGRKSLLERRNAGY